jgi:hypothetical protein
MKKLDAITFDFTACCKGFDEFRGLLAAKDELSESSDVLPFFQARPHLSLLFGQFNSRIAWADRIGWEFDIFGDFACDLVVGEWSRGEYCFVEFEDASSESVFEKRGKKATREWGRRFDHGYSQIIDWAHKLDDRLASADFLARFGVREIKFEAVLVIGRDKHLDMGEKHRLSWRAEKVTVNTKKVVCMTFDELLNQFAVRLDILSHVERATKATMTPPAPPASVPPATSPPLGP